MLPFTLRRLPFIIHHSLFTIHHYSSSKLSFSSWSASSLTVLSSGLVRTALKISSARKPRRASPWQSEASLARVRGRRRVRSFLVSVSSSKARSLVSSKASLEGGFNLVVVHQLGFQFHAGYAACPNARLRTSEEA